MASVYVFRLGLFESQPDGGGLPYVFAETRGFKLHQREDFDVILGMDILAQGNFKMDWTGEWSLEFR